MRTAILPGADVIGALLVAAPPAQASDTMSLTDFPICAHANDAGSCGEIVPPQPASQGRHIKGPDHVLSHVRRRAGATAES